MSSKRAFSLTEVNALVPSLEGLFRRIYELKHEIGARANELERMGVGALLHEGAEPPEVLERRRLIRQRVGEFQAEVSKVEDLGGELYDFDLGLVEFPGIHGGREVSFSWQVGEPTVRYFRERDADGPRMRIEIPQGNPGA